MSQRVRAQRTCNVRPHRLRCVQTIVLSTSAGDSSNHPVAKRGLTIKTRAAGSSNSRTSPLNPMSDAGTSPTPLTPSSLRHAPTPASTTHTASSQPPATTTVDKSSPPPPPHTTGAATAPLSSAAMSRTVSGTSLGGGGDGMLADRALLAFDELLAAAEAAAGGGGAPRARRAAAAAASGMPPADAVGEAALRRSTEACTVASRSTIRPSSYVVLDSEASFSPHSTPTLSSTGRPYAAMYPSAQDLVALEPAAASGGPGRTAGDVLRSIGHLSAASASASDTYGSQLLGPVPDRWLALQPSGSRHSMRSALNAYAAAQAAEDPWAPRSVLSSASGHGTAAVRKSESGSSYYTGRESPAHVEVQLAAAGAESMPEISLHLSGIADTGPIPYPTS